MTTQPIEIVLDGGTPFDEDDVDIEEGHDYQEPDSTLDGGTP